MTETPAPETPACRHCGAPLTRTLVDLGLSPLANSYVPTDRAGIPAPPHPPHAPVCVWRLFTLSTPRDPTRPRTPSSA